MPANRLTVVESLYYQTPGNEPDEQVARFSRPVASDEQPYLRFIKVTEKWILVDCGWVEDVGMLYLSNNAGEDATTIPTKEEEAEIAKQILLLSCDGKCDWLIPPGENFRGTPSEVKDLRIRSLRGTIPVTVYAIPK